MAVLYNTVYNSLYNHIYNKVPFESYQYYGFRREDKESSSTSARPKATSPAPSEEVTWMTRNLIKEVKRYEYLDWPLPRIRLSDSLSSHSGRSFEALILAQRKTVRRWLYQINTLTNARTVIAYMYVQLVHRTTVSR